MTVTTGAEVGLTPRQREIHAAIYASARDTGHMPTILELMGRFGVSSPNGIACHLLALRRKGYLGKAAPRSFCLLRRPDGRPFTGFRDKD